MSYKKPLTYRAYLIYQLMKRNAYNGIMKTTYAQIHAYTKVKSKRTISKYIKELKSKGVIVLVNKSIYQIKPLPKVNHDCLLLPKKVNSKVNYQDQTHVYLYTKNTCKTTTHARTHERAKEDVVVSSENKKFKFSNQSPFQEIREKTLSKFSQRFGYEKVQSTITGLEIKYKNKNSIKFSPTGLLYSALSQDWDLNYQTEEMRHNLKIKNEQEEIAKKIHEQEQREKKERELQNIKDKKDFEEAIKDTGLVDTVVALVEKEFEGKQYNPEYKKMMLKYRVLELYRKRKSLVYA